ncbi:LPD38 domain-containing protein [Aeromonas hydrophila]|uniref:LPD38 domain-containing protein n=1 Tax=Aeromonas hydrophila TaxID=644 RepID=UPI00214BC408|nr:LPD38 domain-containing protein [Aeromonas hydrophila]
MDKPGLRDALPQPQLSDTRTEQFWDDFDSNLSGAMAEQIQPKPTTTKRNLDVGLGDLARGVGAGALDLVGGIGELARQASNFGKENAGKQGGDYLEQSRANMASKLSPVLDVVAGAGDLAQSGAESLTEGMSLDAKEALGRRLVDETPEGRLTMGDGAGDIDVWAMKMAQGVGSLVPTLISGGVTGVAAKASIGRAVTASMIKRGATQEVAEAVAAKTVAKLATGAAVTTGATGSVGSAGVNTRDTVLGMSFDELAASDTFRQSFTRIDQDQQTQYLSDEEKLALAREETANLASRATMSDAKVWGAAAMGSMMGDAMLFKMLAGKAATGGLLKSATKGAAGEGIGETLEEGVQQYAVNESLNEVAAADIDPMKGVVSSALEGGLIGMGTGGALGGVGGLRGGKPQADGESRNLAATSTVEEVAPVEQGEPVPADTVSAQVEPGLSPAVDAVAEPAIPAGEQNPLGPSSSQFDELRDVPAYLRSDDTAERFKGMAEDSQVQEALAGSPAPTVDDLLSQAMSQHGEAIAAPDISSQQPVAAENAVEQPTAATDTAGEPVADDAAQTQSLAQDKEPSALDAVVGPLQTLRITRKGKPFASEKEAAMASRKGKEKPVPLNGGGFGVAEIAEVEQVQAAGQRQAINQRPAEVSNEPVTPVLAVGSEGQSDQLGAGEPAAAGAEPAIAGLTDRAGAGDPADYAAAPPVPDGQQQDDQTLTAPATDAGVAVSEVAQLEPVAPETAVAPTPWAEAIDNPDGTITLKGEVPLIKQWAKDSDVKAIPGKGGMVVAKSSAAKVREYVAPSASEPAQQIDAARAEVAPERSISFSKQAMAQGDKPTKALTRKEAELVTKGWFKQYRGASGIDVQIHATQAELEQALRLAAKEGLIRRAAFDDDNGTLHVAADTIANPKRMREILRHEVLAHYGLANVLGDGEYTKLISRLIKSKKDPSMRPVWDWVNTHYADEDIGVQAEEVVAHLAELEMGSWGRGWDRVVAWVTRALRAVGFVPDGITAAETRTLIEGLGKKMRRADGGMVTAEGDRLWFSAERSPWGKDFPEVILHGRLADATGHPDYAAAKGGDDAAARRLVSDVLSPDAIKQLKKVIGNREAIALGVHAEEAVSRNAIPQAMADVLGKVLGIEVSVDIVQAAKVGRTAQDGFGRLANQPSFDGVVRTDKPYLIMDDTLTQGGTLANLKGYIENRGGEVLAATALTGKQYSAKIAIDSSTLEQLRDQYDGTGLEAWWHNRFGYGFDSLTESEGRYLLRAKDADKVRDRVTAAGYAAPARGEHESARDDGSLPPNGLKFSQSNTAADDALQKLNLGPKPDIIDKTKTNLDKLRKVERSVVKSWLDRFIKKANTEVLDALAPIKYAEDAAGITDAADSGYVAARMATGAASTMQATMLYGLPEWKDGVIQKKAGTGEKDALLGIFSDLGADLHNWLGWMAGHRAELLMDQGRENLLSEQDIAALKGLGKGKEAKFMEAKARWNRLNAATLDLAQEAGLFTKEARAEFESEWYIPFFRESDDGDVIAPFKPKGIANQNAGIKKLKGGEANTNDLLENIFTSTSKLIDASMKNMAAQKTVWNLADTGLIEVIPKPNKMDYQALANGKDRIMLKLEGEEYMLRVEDPDLYRAMTFFDRKPFGKMTMMASSAKRILTAGVTASPEFMLRNFLRDSLSSWAISKDGFKPVIDSIKGVKKTLAMEGSTIDVMFSGASFLGGYVNGNDPTAMADSVRKSLRRKGMTPEQIARYEKSIIRNAAQAKGVVANVWEKYNRFGEAFENGNREAVYDAAIKAGKSHAQAAFESKDLMDFSMLGAARAIQGAAMILPFFNARLQGLGKLTRELRDNPREIAKRAGMITAMSLGLLAMNWDDERYEELPDWDKDANWHFFVGDQHFRIPKPFEIGVMFGTIPERMVRAMGDKDTGAQFGKAVARAIGDTFALNPTPQIVKPLVEAAFNYDTFRGGPIDSPQDLAVKAEARYNEQTSLLMRELGELSGFSPKQLEHLVIGYTGTMGSYVMATADGLIRAARPGESASWRADEIPLVKAVYRGTGPAKSTQHMEEFYRMLNEVNQLKRTVDQYRSEGLTDKANELLDEQGGILKARRSLSRTQQQVRVVRNKIELIQRDRTMNAEEKRRRIDELLARRNDLVYQAVNKNRVNWE